MVEMEKEKILLTLQKYKVVTLWKTNTGIILEEMDKFLDEYILRKEIKKY